MKVIEIFTDGATPNNQNKGNVGRTGGVGVFFGDNDPRNISINCMFNGYYINHYN